MKSTHLSKLGLGGLAGLAWALAGTVTAENWPTWRGPNANGVAPGGNPPEQFSEEKNVQWKIKVPGSGNSTPVIWGDQLFVLTAEKTGKKAYRITTEHQLTFAFAGIWDLWETPDAEIFSFSILTTQSCPELSAIHHRMPIIIQQKYYSDWLTNSHTKECLSGNVSPTLIASQVSNKINNPRNDGPDVWLP